MKIGLVLSSFPGYSETFIYNKIKILIDQGHEVSLFISNRNKKTVNLDLAIYYEVSLKNKFHFLQTVMRAMIFHPLVCLRFIKIERANNANWVYILKRLILNSHFIGKSLDWLHFCFATVAIGKENISESIGAKSAVSLRGFDISIYPHMNSNCYDLLWKKIDKVHSISDDLYKQAIDLGLSPNTPYQKIRPAINTHFFKSTSSQKIHQPIRILTVGRLVWKKGYEYLLKALLLLKDNNIEFEYHIIGDGDSRESILFTIDQMNLQDKIDIKGQLYKDDVKKEMEWADIYIQPSIQEGFCNALLEAQCMGLICISTTAEGLSENIINNKTGFLISKRDPNKIFNKILEVLSMKFEEYSQIRNNARFRVEKEFSLDVQKFFFKTFYFS